MDTDATVLAMVVAVALLGGCAGPIQDHRVTAMPPDIKANIRSAKDCERLKLKAQVASGMVFHTGLPTARAQVQLEGDREKIFLVEDYVAHTYTTFEASAFADRWFDACTKML